MTCFGLVIGKGFLQKKVEAEFGGSVIISRFFTVVGGDKTCKIVDGN